MLQEITDNLIHDPHTQLKLNVTSTVGQHSAMIDIKDEEDETVLILCAVAHSGKLRWEVIEGRSEIEHAPMEDQPFHSMDLTPISPSAMVAQF